MRQQDTRMQDSDSVFDAIAAAAFMRESPGCAAFGHQIPGVIQSPRLATTLTDKSVAGLMINNPTSDEAPLFVSVNAMLDSSLPGSTGAVADASCDSEASTETHAPSTKSQQASSTESQAPGTKSQRKTTFITVHVQEAGRKFLLLALVCFVASNSRCIRAHCTRHNISRKRFLRLGGLLHPTADILVGLCDVFGLLTYFPHAQSQRKGSHSM